MMGFRLVSAAVVVALALSGPLAPVARAQEQQKTEGQMAPAPDRGDGAWRVGAGVATGVNFLFKPLLCALGGATGVAVLVMSLGSGPRWAGRVWEEGCGGPWIITAADLKGEDQEAQVNFWSESAEYQK